MAAQSIYSLLFRIAVIAALNVIFIHAYPQGAPNSVCVSMVPNHSGQPQQITATNTLELSSNTYSANTPITVTLKGAKVGFLIQARRENGGATPVGKFSSVPTNTQTLACSGDDNSVTHKGRVNANDLTFTWTPPSTDVGNIIFYFTVVKSYAVFWVGQPSTTLTYQMTAPSNTNNMNEVVTNEPGNEPAPEGEPGSSGVSFRADSIIILFFVTCLSNVFVV
ncbi:hypothetical protein SNE40_022554 [Patella caerulea]|uniref:Reelin domain-containing protein n=1 Tax=Patella caerulea TaxID=87958 RepID=A0AAN8GB17_PATCE